MEVIKNILIAQIGRGNYIKTKYSKVRRKVFLNETVPAEKDECNSDLKKEEVKYLPESAKLYETGYTFDAVMHELNKAEQKIDTLLIAGTETSYWGNLCRYYLTGGPGDNWQDDLNRLQEEMPDVEFHEESAGSGRPVEYGISFIRDEKIKSSVEKYLGIQLGEKFGCGLSVKVVILTPGLHETQLQENFKILEQALESAFGSQNLKGNKVRINFDISNGYRSLPMYIYAFVNYMTRIKETEFELSMYYGMADAKQDLESGKKDQYAPLVDLNDINELMRWINAVNEFRNFGSVREIMKIFEIRKDWGEIRVGENGEATLAETFKQFDYAANSHNLKVLEETINLLCSMTEDSLHSQDAGLPEQAVLLLDNIADDFKSRFREKEYKWKYGYLTICMAEWYRDLNRIGSAAAALQEGILTYIMERFQDEAQAICGYTKKSDLEEDWKQQFLFKYSTRQDIREKVIQPLADIDSLKDFDEKMKNVTRMIRNTLAHFSYNDSPDENITEDISWLIERTKDDMNKEHSIFEPAVKRKCEEDKRKEEEKEKILAVINNWDNEEFRITEQDFTEEVRRVLEDFIKEIRVLKKLEEAGGNWFERFSEEKKSMKVLPVLLNRWIGSFHPLEIPDKTYCEALRYKKDRKNKYGSERMMNYYKANIGQLMEMIKKMEKF